MNHILKEFKRRLSSGEAVYGPFMKTGDPAFVEACAFAGFDFMILDMEHGPNSLETTQNLVRAAIVGGALPVIRVRDRQAESISQALDIGALGIQVPQLTSPEEVREVIKAARFVPDGQRGVCRFVRAANYSSMPRESYFKEANEALIILQVEGKEAILNIDAILDEKGYDVLFVGPYDLAQAMGIPGQTDHPDLKSEIRKLLGKARKKNCSLGIFTDTIEAAREWKRLGVSYISWNVDVGIFYTACHESLRIIKTGDDTENIQLRES